jgi:hypothetical protein
MRVYCLHRQFRKYGGIIMSAYNDYLKSLNNPQIGGDSAYSVGLPSTSPSYGAPLPSGTSGPQAPSSVWTPSTPTPAPTPVSYGASLPANTAGPVGPSASWTGGSSGGGSSGNYVSSSLPSVSVSAPVTSSYSSPSNSPSGGAGPSYTAPPQPAVVDNMKPILDFLKSVAPKPEVATPYKSTLDPKLTDLLKRIEDFTGQKFVYDPATDAGLKVAQSQSMLKVKNDMAKRGRVFDTYTDTQMQQASQGLIPAYQQIAQQEHNQQGDNMFKTLSAVQGLENLAYGKYRDNVSDINTANTNKYNQYKDTTTTALDMYKTGVTERNNAATQSETKRLNNATIEGKQVDNEVKQYGRALTPISRPQVQAYEQYIQNPVFSRKVTENWGNIAGLINSVPNTPENAELLAALNGARVMKLMQDPQLMAKYGAEYGFGTTAKEAGELADLEGKQFDNVIKAAKASVASEEAKATLDKIQNEVTKGNIENAKSMVEASYLEPKLKLELQDKISAIETRSQSSAIGWANVATGQKNAETSRMNAENSKDTKGQPTMSQVVSTAKSYIDDVMNEDGNAAAKNYIVSSNLSKEDKLTALNMLNITMSNVPSGWGLTPK